MNIELVAILIATVSAFSAATTTLIHYSSNRRVNKSQQARIITDFSRRYASEDMRQAFNALARFYRGSSNDLSAAWRNLSENDEQHFDRLNGQRRFVTRYYKDIYKLVVSGAIDNKAAKLILSEFGLNIFYTVCLPINISIAKNAREFKRIEATLKRIEPMYDDGTILEGF